MRKPPKLCLNPRAGREAVHPVWYFYIIFISTLSITIQSQELSTLRALSSVEERAWRIQYFTARTIDRNYEGAGQGNSFYTSEPRFKASCPELKPDLFVASLAMLTTE